MAEFELPKGDPDQIEGAITQWSSVLSDLATQTRRAKSGFADALSTWTGPRADDFKDASAGLQLQISEAQSALSESITTMKAYAKALHSARETIQGFQRQAETREAETKHMTKNLDPDSVDVVMAWQHHGQYVSGLERSAQTILSELRQAAQSAAAVIAAQTTAACPGADTLSPAEVARRVHQTTEVGNSAHLLADGNLTVASAWKALTSAEKALSSDDVNDDGSVDWEKVRSLLEVDTTGQDLWALGTAPSAGWALGRLGVAAAQSELANHVFKEWIANLLPEWQRTGVNLDGPGSPGDLEQVMREITGWSVKDDAGVQSMVEAEATGHTFDEAKAALVRSGLPKWMELGGDAVGVFGYVADPGTMFDRKAEMKDRVASGLNLLGLGMLKTGQPLVKISASAVNKLAEAAKGAAADGADLAAAGEESSLAVEGGEVTTDALAAGSRADGPSMRMFGLASPESGDLVVLIEFRAVPGLSHFALATPERAALSLTRFLFAPPEPDDPDAIEVPSPVGHVVARRAEMFPPGRLTDGERILAYAGIGGSATAHPDEEPVPVSEVTFAARVSRTWRAMVIS